jgi:hypothetical protein
VTELRKSMPASEFVEWVALSRVEAQEAKAAAKAAKKKK